MDSCQFLYNNKSFLYLTLLSQKAVLHSYSPTSVLFPLKFVRWHHVVDFFERHHFENNEGQGKKIHRGLQLIVPVVKILANVVEIKFSIVV